MLTGDSGISIALIISMTSIACTLYTVFSTSKRQKDMDDEARKKAIEAEQQRQLDIEKNFVKINFKLDDFCDTTKKLLRNEEKNAEMIKDIRERLVKAEDAMTIHEKQLDNHEKRITKIEHERREGPWQP